MRLSGPTRASINCVLRMSRLLPRLRKPRLGKENLDSAAPEATGEDGVMGTFAFYCWWGFWGCVGRDGLEGRVDKLALLKLAEGHVVFAISCLHLRFRPMRAICSWFFTVLPLPHAPPPQTTSQQACSKKCNLFINDRLLGAVVSGCCSWNCH